MQLFYAPDITLPRYTLSEEESRHCAKVLRLGRGDTLHLTDGRGNMHTAKVIEPDPRRCEIEVTATVSDYQRLPYMLTLAVAPTKNIDRYEWMLEKATEIGVDTIIPVACRRSERKIFNAERGRRIVAGAMKQSLKAYLPRVDELTPFEKVVTAPFDGVKLIAHCDEGAKESIGGIVRPNDNILVLIGPEGDFTPDEVALAIANGFRPISLGDSRLRTETAGIMAAAEISIATRPI